MKNVLIISTIEEELLSNVDDGTNRLFINGSEIPSTDWMGTGNYTATVEGHAITIAKIDVDSLDGLNVSLAKTADYTYEMRRRVPTTIVVDDALSTSSINPVQNKVITNALNDKYAKTGGLINSSSSNTPVQIRGNSDSETWVKYEKKTAGELLGYIGVKDDNKPHFYNTADHEIALKDEVLPLTGGTLSGGLKVNDGGLTVKGRINGSGDDEGLLVEYASNGYAGVILGGTSGRHFAMYLIDDDTINPRFKYKDGSSNSYYVTLPSKTGTIALAEDAITYNLTGLVTAGKTISDYFIDFLNAHKSRENYEGRFYITSTNTPSDIPENTTEWRYSYGRFLVRNCNANGVADGLIELHGFGTNRIARKYVQNNTISSTWEINDEALKRFGGLKGVIAIAQTSSSTPNVDVPVVVWTTYLAIGTYSGTIGMWLILCANGSISVSPIIANTKVTFTYVNNTTLRVSCSQRANITIIDCGKS